MQERSILSKAITLIVCVVLGALVGNAVMAGLLLSQGVSIGDIAGGIFDLLSNADLSGYVKAGIAVSHFMTFTASAVLFWWWVERKVGFKKYFGFGGSYDPSVQMVFIALLICSYPIIVATTTIFDYIELPTWMQNNDMEQFEALAQVLNMDGPLDLLVNLVIVALLPAIGEELIFRGIIQGELVKKLRNPHIAILIASIIFSAIHLQIEGFLPKLVIGLVLGYSYYWTKQIIYPMILHFLNNGMSVVGLYLAGGVADIEQVETPAASSTWIAALIGAALVYFLVHYILKNIAIHEPKA